jgi:plasmid stabilization system protein ParE
LARQLRVAARAAGEIRTASQWWLENRRAAPELLRQELEKAFILIATEPRVGSPALDAGLEGVRRLHLSRVRYHLYYRLGDDDA